MEEKYVVNAADLVELADKIREKNKNTDKIIFPEGFINAVDEMGSGLNFEVVGGTVQSENPKENTIWVNTDAEITGWIVSPSQPENQIDGLVWIRTSDYTGIEFNVLEENRMIQYALEVRQYISGTWVICTAQIYVNDEWKDVVGNYLYNAGDQMIGLTGGWHLKYKGEGGVATASFGSNYMTLKQTNIDYGRIETVNKIDTSGYTKLCIEYSITNASGGYQTSGLCISYMQTPNEHNNGNSIVLLGGSVSAGVKKLDISSVTDPVYILIVITGVLTLNIIRVWLE